MQDIVLVGGGGHCRSCIDVIEECNAFRIAGILDVPSKVGQEVCGYPVVAADSETARFAREGCLFLITVGQVGAGDHRAELFERIRVCGGRFATVVSPRAHVSRRAEVKEGSIIMHDALLNSCVKVGKNCIVNSKVLIEHDAVVAAHCHISTGAILNGGANVEERSFVGSGAIIVEGRTVPRGTFVKAGSVWIGPKRDI